MITKQEMFDRAVRGLASQGWERCVFKNACVFTDDKGKRCAWGWVDTSLGSSINGNVRALWEHGIGIAAQLNDSDLEFALALQEAHDRSYDMDKAFRHFGKHWGLEWPLA
jgi:hypothetical protein